MPLRYVRIIIAQEGEHNPLPVVQPRFHPPCFVFIVAREEHCIHSSGQRGKLHYPPLKSYPFCWAHFWSCSTAFMQQELWNSTRPQPPAYNWATSDTIHIITRAVWPPYCYVRPGRSKVSFRWPYHVTEIGGHNSPTGFQGSSFITALMELTLWQIDGWILNDAPSAPWRVLYP